MVLKEVILEEDKGKLLVDVEEDERKMKERKETRGENGDQESNRKN